MGELTKMAQKAIEKGLCDHCLGRMVGRLGTGLSNDQRGLILHQMIKEEGGGPGKDGGEEHFIALAGEPPTGNPNVGECSLCGGLFSRLDEFKEIVVGELDEYQYDNFLMGTRPDPEMSEKEEILWQELGTKSPEPLKIEINREVGKRVAEHTGKDVEFDHPDLVAVLDVLYNFVEVSSNPVHFYGRYQKLERGIPQTRWPCRRCKGKGCDRCNGTGKMYQTSVEELVCKPLMEELGGDEHSFHGMGREDIDALMLGTGRPFVAEVKHPHKRHADLQKMEELINNLGKDRIRITGLRESDKDEVRRIKDAASDKSYRVRVKFEEEVGDEELDKTLELAGVELKQRTPQRVSHRRADKIRKRTIIDIKHHRQGPDLVDFDIKAMSGTYIKEFCNGDDGRTKPSISEMIGIPCSVLHLDVLCIHDVEE